MTTDEFRRNSDNYCFRHPDRQSFVLCQRCLRTVCPECQTQGAVGVICPDCMAEQRRSQSPVQRKAERRWSRPREVSTTASGRPMVTLTIVAITGLIYVLGLVPGVQQVLVQYLAFASVFVDPGSPYGFQPWRLLTALLVHDGIWHIGLNMLALWFMGRSLEPLLGGIRFLVLYLIGGLGGSVAVALLAPDSVVVGASGAIFGLFGALLVIGRHLGANIRVIAILIAINFALPFVLALISAIGTGSIATALGTIRISWQAHLGGLVAGAVVGLVYARTRLRRQRQAQIWLLVATVVLLCGLLAIPSLLAA